MTILTAVDGERVPSPTIEEGYELARRLDEDLVVLHVMPEEIFEEAQVATTPTISGTSLYHEAVVPYDAESISSGGPTPFSIEDGEANAANIARAAVEETLDEWNNVTFQGRVGDSVEEILREAERRDVHYLVMGPRKQTPVKQAVFGSTTQAVLLNADRPVVTVPREE